MGQHWVARMCRRRASFRENFLVHPGQMKFFSPECVRACRDKSWDRANPVWQAGQTNSLDRTTSWTFECERRLKMRVKDRLHPGWGQSKLLPSFVEADSETSRYAGKSYSFDGDEDASSLTGDDIRGWTGAGRFRVSMEKKAICMRASDRELGDMTSTKKRVGSLMTKGGNLIPIHSCWG